MTDTATVLGMARRALERYLDVSVDPDGALTFRHGDMPCAVQGIQLTKDLPVLSLTCVIAWDLTSSDVPARIGERAAEGLFGTLGAVRSERGWEIGRAHV